MSLCRVCHSSINSIFSFGKMPIANGFLNSEEFLKEYFFELAIDFCQSCKMLQLKEQPDSKKMFHENYAFFSSTSRKMAEHFEKMANNYLTNIQNSLAQCPTIFQTPR